MDMVYTQDTLKGFGNLYHDLNGNPPVDSYQDFEYRNRVSTPGIVFDHNDTSYLGYYNYLKKDGELRRLEGVYESFLYYDQKRTDEEPENYFLFKNEVIIGEADENGNFPVLIKEFDENGNITSEINKTITIEDVNNERVLLIRFQEKDYLFLSFSISDTTHYFHPGLFTIKE